MQALHFAPDKADRTNGDAAMQGNSQNGPSVAASTSAVASPPRLATLASILLSPPLAAQADPSALPAPVFSLAVEASPLPCASPLSGVLVSASPASSPVLTPHPAASPTAAWHTFDEEREENEPMSAPPIGSGGQGQPENAAEPQPEAVPLQPQATPSEPSDSVSPDRALQQQPQPLPAAPLQSLSSPLLVSTRNASLLAGVTGTSASRVLETMSSTSRAAASTSCTSAAVQPLSPPPYSLPSPLSPRLAGASACPASSVSGRLSVAPSALSAAVAPPLPPRPLWLLQRSGAAEGAAGGPAAESFARVLGPGLSVLGTPSGLSASPPSAATPVTSTPASTLPAYACAAFAFAAAPLNATGTALSARGSLLSPPPPTLIVASESYFPAASPAHARAQQQQQSEQPAQTTADAPAMQSSPPLASAPAPRAEPPLSPVSLASSSLHSSCTEPLGDDATSGVSRRMSVCSSAGGDASDRAESDAEAERWHIDMHTLTHIPSLEAHMHASPITGGKLGRALHSSPQHMMLSPDARDGDDFEMI